MLKCWEMEPKLRPSFTDCKRRIGQYLKSTDATYSFIKDQLPKEWTLAPSIENPGYDDRTQTSACFEKGPCLPLIEIPLNTYEQPCSYRKNNPLCSQHEDREELSALMPRH